MRNPDGSAKEEGIGLAEVFDRVTM